MDKLNWDIDILLQRLAQPAQRAIRTAGINNLQGLSQLSIEEFIHLHGIGKNATAIAVTVLKEQGLSFSDKKV